MLKDRNRGDYPPSEKHNSTAGRIVATTMHALQPIDHCHVAAVVAVVAAVFVVVVVDVFTVKDNHTLSFHVFFFLQYF